MEDKIIKLDTTEFQLIDLEKRVAALEKLVEILLQSQTDHANILNSVIGVEEVVFEPDEELLKEIDPGKKKDTH